MRQRTIRTLGSLIGVAIIITVLSFSSYAMRLSASVNRFNEMRDAASMKLDQLGWALEPWDTFRAAKGSFHTGPAYSAELESLDGTVISMVGYGVPIEHTRFALGASPDALFTRVASAQASGTYRNVRTMLFTPVPFDAYFRGQPPVNEVILVHLQPTGRSDVPTAQPVFVQGELALIREGGRFFYKLDNARALAD